MFLVLGGRFRHFELGRFGSFVWCWRRCERAREGADQDDELPALIFAELLAEGGHGLASLGDLVVDFAVGELAHVRRVGEVAGCGVVHHCVGAVALTGIAVAVGTVFVIERFGSVVICLCYRQRIFAGLFL